jgi:hypothetical protein
MKLTNKLRSEIKRAVRAACSGYTKRAFTEIGMREVGDGSYTSFNALLWTDDSDLYDKRDIGTVIALGDDAENPRFCLLDAYVYDGRNGDLTTNCYVFIRDGHVVGATAENNRYEALRQSLGFPATRGW